VINRLLIFLLRIMVCATLFAGDGLAANIRISETGRVDGLHNGSIDVDTALTSNMTDERAIVCNFYFEGVVSAGDRNKLLSIMQVWRRAHKLESPRICLNSPGGSYDEGLAIAELLMGELIGTAVEADAVCASACALIFMAGSAPWKGQLNRFLHVSGLVAFHAPYLDPSKMAGQPLSAADVAPSFERGLRAVNRLIKLGQGRVAHFFDNELLSEMLDRGPNEIFAIDTVIKAIRYRVALYGARAPRISPETLVNACINYFYGGRLQLTPQELSEVKATKMKRFLQGLRAEFDVAPRGGSCTIDLVTNGDAVIRWVFHRSYPGNEGFDGPTSITLAYWYLYPPATPIATMSR